MRITFQIDIDFFENEPDQRLDVKQVEKEYKKRILSVIEAYNNRGMPFSDFKRFLADQDDYIAHEFNTFIVKNCTKISMGGKACRLKL